MRAARIFAALVVIFGIAGCRASRPGPNVVLIGIESLRADELKTFGATKSPVSYLDLLATKGVTFTQARASSSWALPSWASVLTGRSPSANGIVEVGNQLDRSIETLAERFAQGGFQTGAIVTNPLLAKQVGFARGYGSYIERFNAPASAAAQAAETWIDENRDRSFFLTIDLAGPQMPYESEDEDESKFRKADLPIRQFGPRDAMQVVNHWPEPAAQAGLSRARELYRAELDHVDRAILRIIQHLQKRRLEYDTILVIFSTNGEEFMDRGLMNNRLSLSDELVRVPLIVVAPGAAPAGRKIDAPVGLVDLFATLADLAGIGEGPDGHGQSLRPLWHGEPKDIEAAANEFRARPIIIETSHTGPDRIAVVVDGHKAVFSGRFSVHGRDLGPELYDLEKDPGERSNLAKDNPDSLAPFDQHLRSEPSFSRRRTWRVTFGGTERPTLYSGRVTTSGRFVSSFKLSSRFQLGKTQLVSDDFLLVRGPQSLYFAATGEDGGNGFQFVVEPADARVEVTPLLDGHADTGVVETSIGDPARIPVDLATLADATLADAVHAGYAISSEWIWTSSADSGGIEITDQIRPGIELINRLAVLVEKRDRTLRDLFLNYAKGETTP
ncbi:MAG: sulfatase-like hydrolase/transferase [Deltaproteobacteria bacterium]|nr:sulfatase-like hydrolase/transferase [Deltaproteobacteria bacterium]